MYTLYNGLDLALTVVLALLSLGVLLVRGPPEYRVCRRARRWADRLLPSRILDRLRWPTVALVVGAAYAVVAGFDLATGLYGCSGTATTSDPVALLRSGQAFWAGRDPFVVQDCGVTTTIPYGLAAVLVNALGSLGGSAGLSAAWGLVAVALVPLVWWATPVGDRRYVLLFVALLPLYLPLVASQIDGASNAIAPLAVLATIVLSRRSGRLAEVVGGFLSTARFPTLFPVLATRGSERRWFVGALLTLGTFGAVTALTYARWGSSFYRIVFTGQVNRRSFSLNLYGVLLDHAALPTGTDIVVLQAALIILVTGFAFFLVRDPLRAAAVALTGYALLTPFLSFSILLALLPVALVGQRERWWLWGAGIVAAVNYDLALSFFAWQGGSVLPSDVLDVVLTVVLLGLFVELVRRRREPLGAPGGAGATPARPKPSA